MEYRIYLIISELIGKFRCRDHYLTITQKNRYHFWYIYFRMKIYVLFLQVCTCKTVFYIAYPKSPTPRQKGFFFSYLHGVRKV